MEKTVKARWEWRSFSVTSLDSIINKLRRLPLGNHKENCDIYVLSDLSGVNVKIRSDGVLDMKLMKDCRERGFELWLPRYRCSAPFLPENILKLSSYFKTPSPAMKRKSYSVQEFLSELAPSWNALNCFFVSKVRDIYAVDDVIMEVGEISFYNGHYRTFCVESERLESVMTVVHGFELEQYVPMNYVQFLKGAKP